MGLMLGLHVSLKELLVGELRHLGEKGANSTRATPTHPTIHPSIHPSAQLEMNYLLVATQSSNCLLYPTSFNSQMILIWLGLFRYECLNTIMINGILAFSVYQHYIKDEKKDIFKLM